MSHTRFLMSVTVFLFVWIFSGLTTSMLLAQDAAVPTSVYYERKSDLYHHLPNTDDEIIMLGNSITDGGEWIELLGDYRIKNRGISGDVTRGIINRLDEVIESKPLQIFLLIGINDLAKGATIENISGNIETILSRIIMESPATNIYVQSVFPVNPEWQQYPKHVSKGSEVIALNKLIKKTCEIRSLNYLDVYSVLSTQDGLLIPEYTNDGLHLSGKGYLVWAEIIQPHLHQE